MATIGHKPSFAAGDSSFADPKNEYLGGLALKYILSFNQFVTSGSSAWQDQSLLRALQERQATRLQHQSLTSFPIAVAIKIAVALLE